MAMTVETPALLSVDEAIERAGGRPGRTAAYEQIRTEGHFLGVRPIRVARRVFIPRAALDKALSGELIASNE